MTAIDLEMGGVTLAKLGKLFVDLLTSQRLGSIEWLANSIYQSWSMIPGGTGWESI
jgi:hypothetical protein